MVLGWYFWGKKSQTFMIPILYTVLYDHTTPFVLPFTVLNAIYKSHQTLKRQVHVTVRPSVLDTVKSNNNNNKSSNSQIHWSSYIYRSYTSNVKHHFYPFYLSINLSTLTDQWQSSVVCWLLLLLSVNS